MHQGCDLMQMSSRHVHRQYSDSLGAHMLMHIISMQELVALKTELHNSKIEKSAASDQDLQHAHPSVATQVRLTLLCLPFDVLEIVSSCCTGIFLPGVSHASTCRVKGICTAAEVLPVMAA